MSHEIDLFFYDRLKHILYDRPVGMDVLGYAIDTIERLRRDLKELKNVSQNSKQVCIYTQKSTDDYKDPHTNTSHSLQPKFCSYCGSPVRVVHR